MPTHRRAHRMAVALLIVGLLSTTTTAPAGASAGRRASTRTTLTATPGVASVGQAVTVQAAVSFTRAGGRTPSGRVYFVAANDRTALYLGSAPLAGCSLTTLRCTATLVTSALPPGRDTLGSLYAGNRYFWPSVGLTSVTVTATGERPGAPELTSATAGDGQVALEWSAPRTGGPATSYNVYRSDVRGVPGALLAPGVSGTAFTDLSAANDSTYYYGVTAVNGSGESLPSNELSARPPSSSASATTCAPAAACDSPTVVSSDGSTQLQASSEASAGQQVLTVQVGGLGAMLCTLPGSGSVVSEYHTTAADAPKVADYTVFGDAATFAHSFYAAHTDISGCYGSTDPFNGWSPDESYEGTWAEGPYVYGPAPFDEGIGLYEAFLGSCANHSGYQPCFTNISGEGFNTTRVTSPASAGDPRVSH